MKDYDLVILIGYCSYCKNEVYSDVPYEEKKGEFWHSSCVGQMNTYVDEFGDNHRYG